MNQDDDIHLPLLFPLSHWESLGYDFEHAFANGVLQGTLLRGISALKQMGQTTMAGAATNTDVNVCVGIDDTALPELLPDGSLLPTWERFAEALRLLPFNERGYLHLGIRNVQLPKVVLEALEPALKTAPIDQLTLMNNQLGPDGIRFLTRVLEANPAIRSLCLDENEIDCGVEMLSLLEAARNHSHLTVQLKNCGVASLLQNEPNIAPPLFSLQSVSLMGSQLGSHAASLISNCLATNPRINVLDLDDNLLNDEDAALIANSLKTNTNLRLLFLCGNDFTAAGIKTLCKSVYDDQSLNAIKDSNHTCELILFAEDEPIPSGIDEAALSTNGKTFRVHDFPDSAKKRFFEARRSMRDANEDGCTILFGVMLIEGRMKIKMLHALEGGSTGQFNMKYLNDVSLKLMPEVFTFVQESGKISGTEDKNLDVLFEVIRATPGVVSFHSTNDKKRRLGGISGFWGHISQLFQPKKRRLG